MCEQIKRKDHVGFVSYSLMKPPYLGSFRPLPGFFENDI